MKGLNFPQILLLSLLLAVSTIVQAQKQKYNIDRCGAVSRTNPVHNVVVGSDNVKSVGSGQSWYQVRACNTGTLMPLELGELSVFSFFGGNTDLRWKTEIMLSEARGATDITCAWYDAKNDWLWIGTKTSGLFQFKTKPALTFVAQRTAQNSKIKSNEITSIFQDNSGKYWIGTAEGMLVGAPDKWKNELDGYRVQRVRAVGADFYVLADSEFWIVQSDRFKPINIDEKALEGEAVDFDFDPAGQLWVVSRMLARYDLNTDEFDIFSGPEYYTSEYGKCIAADTDGTIWVGTEDKGLYRIEKAASFTANALVEQELSCTGNGKDAALIVKLEGGKAPFTYQWSNASLSGNNPKNLAAGNYTVTVTDVSGVTKTSKVTILDAQPKLSAAQKKPESGPENKDGSAELTIEGGTKPYQIKWSTGETSLIASKLAEGKYSVTVTDQKGCSATTNVTITQQVTSLSVMWAWSAQIKCNGGNGSVKVTPIGGKPPYQYLWSNPAYKGAQIDNLTAGTYQVTVTDALGTSVVSPLNVSEPPAFVATIQVTGAASTGLADGKAMADGKGGTGKYTYAWDNGETTVTATKLAAGKHSVTLTDANGCTTIATAELHENVLPLSVVIQENEKIGCFGKTGSLKVQVSGGKPPFQYKWNAPALQGEAPTGVSAGNYILTVTDATNTTSTANFSLKQPDELSVKAVVTSPAATDKQDGKATAESKGGTGKYIYAWDSGESSANASKLGAGKHSVTLTDANGCSVTGSFDMKENILPLTVNIQENENIRCNGATGSLKASVTGGKAPYQYQWSAAALQGDRPTAIPAGTYQLTVTDAVGGTTTAAFTLKQPDAIVAKAVLGSAASTNKADGKANVQGEGGTGKYTYAWDNGETTATATKLAAGTHSVTLSDANSCTAIATIDVTENILPLALRLEETGKIKCAGQSSGIKVIVSGGKTPYKYQWSDAKLQGESPLSVLAGTYQLTITDVPGATVVASITIRQPQPIAINATVTASASTGNADGKASITALGGAGKFTYAWDNGEITAAASKLAPGKHSVTVTDGNNCTATEQIEITENILPLAVTLLETGAIKCAGEKSSLKATVSGGKPPFQYRWNETSWNTSDVSAVNRGTYKITVTDAKNTTTTAEIIVKGPDSLLANVLRSGGATTERSKDAWASLDIKGGTKPYAILWDNGENTSSASKLTFGARQVTVTDANNCSAFASVEIGKRILPELSAASLTSGQAIKVEQLRFDADSSSLNPSSYPVLDEVFNFLQENGTIVIEVGGHTNNVPSDAFADKLSAARAKAAADYLINKGVDRNRVLYKGYGKRKPIASNSTAEGRKENQRVEIKILEIKKQ